MIEEVAKTKWCPFAGGPNPRSIYEGRYNSRCIASACMAWRWMVVGDGYSPIPFIVPSKEAGEVMVGDSPNRRVEGYCGYAGVVG